MKYRNIAEFPRRDSKPKTRLRESRAISCVLLSRMCAIALLSRSLFLGLESLLGSLGIVCFIPVPDASWTGIASMRSCILLLVLDAPKINQKWERKWDTMRYDGRRIWDMRYHDVALHDRIQYNTCTHTFKRTWRREAPSKDRWRRTHMANYIKWIQGC